MKPVLAAAAFAATLLAAGATPAAERTVTLAVEGMTCASCPYIVQQVLAGVSGVRAVDVSFEEKKAVVAFDDGRMNVAALTAATANVGFPSRLMQ